MARPEIGQAINVRLGDERLSLLDAYAAALDVSRAEALRQAVDTWLADDGVCAAVRSALRERVG